MAEVLISEGLEDVVEASEDDSTSRSPLTGDVNDALNRVVDRVKIKDGIDIEALRRGGDTIFEIDDAAIEKTREEFKEEFRQANQTCYSQALIENKDLLKDLDYDGLGGYGLGLAGDEDSDCDGLQPFETLAKKMEPLTADGLVKKRTKRPGGGDLVCEGALVQLHYNGYLEHHDEPFDSTRLRNKVEKVVLGKGALIPGLELGIRSMKAKEIASFLISYEYAWGEMGCPPRIPEKATVFFEVELLYFHNEAVIHDFDNLMDPDERNKFCRVHPAAVERKKEGNDYYSRKLYAKAATQFKVAVDDLEKCNLADEEEQKEQVKLLFALYKNLAVVSIKQKKYHRAIKYATKGLDAGPDAQYKKDAKCNYLAAKANRLIGEFDMAEMYIKKASKGKPQDKDIQQEVKNLNEDKLRHKMTEKVLAQRMILPKEEQTTLEELERAQSAPWISDPDSLILYMTHLEKFFADDENKVYKVYKSKIETEADVQIWEEAARRQNLFVIQRPTQKEWKMRIGREPPTES